MFVFFQTWLATQQPESNLYENFCTLFFWHDMVYLAIYFSYRKRRNSSKFKQITEDSDEHVHRHIQCSKRTSVEFSGNNSLILCLRRMRCLRYIRKFDAFYLNESYDICPQERLRAALHNCSLAKLLSPDSAPKMFFAISLIRLTECAQWLSSMGAYAKRLISIHSGTRKVLLGFDRPFVRWLIMIYLPFLIFLGIFYYNVG